MNPSWFLSSRQSVREFELRQWIPLLSRDLKVSKSDFEVLLNDNATAKPVAECILGITIPLLRSSLKQFKSFFPVLPCVTSR